MTKVYFSCLKPKGIDRYIAFAKRKLKIHPTVTLDMDLDSARRRLWHRPFPTSVNIILGNQCNLHCEHCPYHGPTSPSVFATPVSMNDGVVDRLMDQLPRHKTNAKFGGYEEPLLYRSFQKLADHLLRNNIGVHLTTNGTLITSRVLPTLRSLSSLYVSVDAATAKTYLRIRGGDLNDLMRKISAVADGFKGRMGVSFIRNPVSLSEERDFLDFWLSRVNMVIYYALLRFGAQEYIIDQPFLQMPSERVVCSSPWLETYVLPNGEVSLCCQTLAMTGRSKIPIMGNVEEQTLEEIWNGQVYETYRRALLEEDWSTAAICRDCPLWAASYYKIQWQKNLKITCNPTTRVIEKIAG